MIIISNKDIITNIYWIELYKLIKMEDQPETSLYNMPFNLPLSPLETQQDNQLENQPETQPDNQSETQTENKVDYTITKAMQYKLGTELVFSVLINSVVYVDVYVDLKKNSKRFLILLGNNFGITRISNLKKRDLVDVLNRYITFEPYE